MKKGAAQKKATESRAEKAKKRNDKVTEILNGFFEQAGKETLDIDETLYAKPLDALFTTTAWGFREILLVVVVGMKLDAEFKASSHFYQCNPRAIYETPIKNFLIEKNIPHRLSGPLNVAKAAEGLNEAWAAQRRPKEVAECVVQMVDLLEQNDEGFLDNVGVSLMRKFIAETKRVEAFDVEIDFSADPEWLFHVSAELIDKAPDAGNTPQKIAALLLWTHHECMHTGVKVTGGDDRASVTSTTSKKPGDVNEESFETGRIFKVYEITVKPFHLARIQDSYDCVKTYNQENETDIHEVIVICRPQDCPEEMSGSRMNICLGSYRYRDIIYYYWDIYEWICFMLQRMTDEARKGYYTLLNSYIANINTAETVKQLWKELHSSQE